MENHPLIDLEWLQSQFAAGLTKIDLEGVILPPGSRLFSTEPLAPAPRAGRGTFLTRDPKAFCEYVIAEQAGPAAVFIDEDPPCAMAVLNFDSWQDNTAECRPVLSPPYRALTHLVEPACVTQQPLLNFIEDWSTLLSFRRGETVIHASAAHALFADLTVDKINRSRSNDSTPYARERSAAETISMGTGLPERMVIDCQPWQGLPNRQIEVSLSASISGSAPAIAMRIIAKGALDEALLQDLRNLIAEELAADANILPGSYRTALKRADVIGG